jgi:hypothetical protein
MDFVKKIRKWNRHYNPGRPKNKEETLNLPKLGNINYFSM